MNNVRMAFFGTSDRSIPLLESLKDSFNLALCVTKRDVKVGRDQESKETGVKKWAKENNVRYVEVNSLKENDLEQVMKDLKTQKIEYGIVADFAFIIPEKLIEHFESKNLINIHFFTFTQVSRSKSSTIRSAKRRRKHGNYVSISK